MGLLRLFGQGLDVCIKPYHSGGYNGIIFRKYEFWCIVKQKLRRYIDFPLIQYAWCIKISLTHHGR